MITENKIKTERFRIRTKRLFLTYPQVPGVENIEEQFVKVLKNNFEYNKNQ